MKQESILCIQKKVFEDIFPGQEGLIEMSERDKRVLFSPANMWFGPREVLEEDPTFLQIIPYTVVTNSGRVGLYKRTTKGGDKRLHLKYSLGFGGHIGLQDFDPERCLIDEVIQPRLIMADAAVRELDEELSYGDILTEKKIGLIYDPSNAVGEVHLGVVTLIEVSAKKLKTKEDSQTECQYLRIEEIASYKDMLEGWSILVYEYLLDVGVWEKSDPEKSEDEKILVRSSDQTIYLNPDNSLEVQ